MTIKSPLRTRITELTFHFLELMGGYLTVILMFLIKHKTRKIGYCGIMYLMFIA
ncbi:MAG: DUF1294 domain-containing protein [Paludibacteraceae bacterium]